ncbi:hypothetical protein [Paractinoplanes brasiliensis]|uniref:hypothetical protein n=1 Tax=Paractinoplanes brasiliensis TaxID=52695 RepID=UPI00141526E4|nr:hypothetical protein [Actinoplanes brasiliensis]
MPDRPELVYDLPRLPPCTVLSFSKPKDEGTERWWQWDDAYVVIGTTMWTRRDASSRA